LSTKKHQQQCSVLQSPGAGMDSAGWQGRHPADYPHRTLSGFPGAVNCPAEVFTSLLQTCDFHSLSESNKREYRQCSRVSSVILRALCGARF
jgi:hypothetical protein